MGNTSPHVHRVSHCVTWAVEQGGERHCVLPFWKFSQRKADPDPASCMHRVSFSQPLNFLWTPTLLGLPRHFGIHFFSDCTFSFWDSHPFWPPDFFWPFTPFQPPTPFQALCSELAEPGGGRRTRSKLVATCWCLALQNSFLSFPVTLGVGAHSSRVVVVVHMDLKALSSLVTPHVCRPTFEHLHVKHLNQPDLTLVSPACCYLAAAVISGDSLILSLFLGLKSCFSLSSQYMESNFLKLYLRAEMC